MTRQRLFLVAAMLTACAPAGGDLPAELMEVDRDFARAVAERGVDGWVSFFATDGMMVGGQMTTQGPDEIWALMAPAFADTTYALEWEPTRAEVAASGDFGYTLGRYVSTVTDSGGSVVRQTGSYVTVWRKDVDGSWKVALDVGSPDQTP